MKSAFVRLLSPLFFISLLLFGFILLEGCGTDKEEPPPLKLDTAYLESEDYQRFKQNLEREQTRNINERERINRAVAKVLSRTQSELSLPARFTTDNLAAFTDSSSRILLKSGALNRSVFGEYSYYPVGKTRKGDFTVLFFLLRKNVTTDIELDLMVATIDSSGTVHSARSVAPFRKAVAGMQVRSEVEITPELHIVSRIRDSGSVTISSASVEYRDYLVRQDGRIVDPPFEP